MKIHKINDDTPFGLKSVCGIYPQDKKNITSDDNIVACKKCNRDKAN